MFKFFCLTMLLFYYYIVKYNNLFKQLINLILSIKNLLRIKLILII